MYRLEDVIDMSKLSKMDLGKLDPGRLGALLGKKEEEKKKTNPAVWVAVIVGIVAVAAAIGYGVYRYFAPDYLEDFEDDFDDEFDDEFFEDEEEESDEESKDEE